MSVPRNGLPFAWIAVVVVAVVIGQLVHHAVPVGIGFLAGVDAVLAIVLLLRSRGGISQTATDPR